MAGPEARRGHSAADRLGHLVHRAAGIHHQELRNLGQPPVRLGRAGEELQALVIRAAPLDPPVRLGGVDREQEGDLRPGKAA
jgi:hypothetical protein